MLERREAVLVRAPEASVPQERAVLMQIPLPEGVVLLVHKLVAAAQFGAHHKVLADLHLRHAEIGVGQLDVADQALLLGLCAVPALGIEDQVRRTAERDAGLQLADAAAQMLLRAILHAVDHLKAVLGDHLGWYQDTCVRVGAILEPQPVRDVNGVCVGAREFAVRGGRGGCWCC